MVTKSGNTMTVESRIEVSKHLNQFLIYRGVGDIGMARTIPTEWHRGGMTSPTIGSEKIDKLRMGDIVSAIKVNLPLPCDFTGSVDFFVNLGRLVKADVKPKA